MDGYINVNQFAEKIGKSKQSIYKRLSKQDSDLKPYAKEVDGKVYIAERALQEVYGIAAEPEQGSQPDIQPKQPDFQPEKQPAPLDRQSGSQPGQPDFQPDSQPVNHDFIAFLREQLAQKEERERQLNAIISEKDKQLKEQAAEIANLANKLAVIANNALLTTAQTQYITAGAQPAETEHEEYIMQEDEQPKEEPEKRKSIIRKIIDLFR